MSYTLAQGVQLHVVETKKYKTVRFFVRFTNRLQKETTTKRALLASMMETDSLHYPDQTKISEELANLYGASFGMNVGRKGSLHWINLGLHLVNGKYVNDTELLGKAADFLKEILFYPNIEGNHWAQETFDIEKENLKSYMESLKEDKQAYASLALQSLYFSEDQDQRMPSIGTIGDLEALTSTDLCSYYQQMIQEDKIDIFVIGDVEEEAVAALFAEMPFMDREILHPNIFYHQLTSNIVKEQQAQEPVVQAKLNLAYGTEVYYGTRERFAMMVFNGLFGGFPHSKLFMNVREKESLAYYASSSVDTFRGYLSVQTGIEGKNRDRVLHLIAEQLESLKNGEITDLELEQTKAMLENQYRLSLDSSQSVIETTYLDNWLPETKLSADQWLKKLQEVTVADVQAIAQQLKLQAIFFLDGVDADE